MIGLLLGALLAFGRAKGLLGSLVGGFLGALVLIGMATTARNGDLATLYSPAELAANVVPLAVVAALLALVAPYATAVVSTAWAAGALLAAIAAAHNGQASYIPALAAHFLAAASVGLLAGSRTRAT